MPPLRSFDTLQVKGNYFFSSPDSLVLSAPLYYPFPIDSFAAFFKKRFMPDRDLSFIWTSAGNTTQ